MQNVKYIQAQIESMKMRREVEALREKKYYKPHYGPEETRDLVEWERNRIKAQKKFIQE
jgi:hypothetical protein